MDLENQKRVKEFAEKYGPENVVVLLGAAEGEAAGLAAETVTAGDPTFAGPLTNVQLGLTVYHVVEPEMKEEFDPDVYDEQISMMEMVLDVDDIIDEMTDIRDEYCKYLPFVVYNRSMSAGRQRDGVRGAEGFERERIGYRDRVE